MTKKTNTDRGSVATDSSSRAFRVGDCVIINEVEQPCARMVVVVTADNGEQYQCQYLNAEQSLDSFCKPPMQSNLLSATKVEDFGVVIKASAGQYWCEKRGESKATYSDGKPRNWQEYDGPVKYHSRPHLAEILWPF